MMTRTTINGLQPRTVQDAGRDPFDWLEGPRPGDNAGRYQRLANRLMLVIAALYIVLAVSEVI